jgi:hypothetical protein
MCNTLTSVKANYQRALQRNPIYVLTEQKLRSLIPSFNIYESVSDLYILRFGPPTFLQQNMQINRGNI